MNNFDIFLDFGGDLGKLQNALNKLKKAGFVTANDAAYETYPQYKNIKIKKI